MTVLLGTPVTVDITLEIAKANMQLVVTAEAPLVEADNGDVSITMSQRQISELPNPGNDLTYIAQTAPGAIMNPIMRAYPLVVDSPAIGEPLLMAKC